MIIFKDLIEMFGERLFSERFQTFLKANFEDLTVYNILDSDYIVSKQKGFELGFTNSTAVFDDDDQILFEPGDPIFSHFNRMISVLSFSNKSFWMTRGGEESLSTTMTTFG